MTKNRIISNMNISDSSIEKFYYSTACTAGVYSSFFGGETAGNPKREMSTAGSVSKVKIC